MEREKDNSGVAGTRGGIIIKITNAVWYTCRKQIRSHVSIFNWFRNIFEIML